MLKLQEQELSIFERQLDTIGDIDSLKSQIDELRPLSRDQEAIIMQKFRLDWTYHSNAIEGNSLDYGETVAFLMHGITSNGKPFKDYVDIKGHNSAIEYLIQIVRGSERLTLKDIRSIHELLLREPYEVRAQTEDGTPVFKLITPGRYKQSPNHVRTNTGEIHYYTSPEDTEFEMQNLIAWYEKNIEDVGAHPVILSAALHYWFVAIHPFDDGNGRMTRLLMNLVLMKFGFPPIVIKYQDKNKYYLALSQADAGDFMPFLKFISERLIDSLNIYLKGARGESIEEESDLDKEITLFKKEIQSRKDKVESKRTLAIQKELYDKTVLHLLEEVKKLMTKFADLFITYEETILISDEEGWHYYLPSSLGFDTLEAYLKSLFLSEVDFGSVILNFRLSEFKVDNNLFGLEYKVYINFFEYKYAIYTALSEDFEMMGFDSSQIKLSLHAPEFSNYYHQLVSPYEISSLVQKSGKNIFEFIRANYLDPSRRAITLSEGDISLAWSDYLELPNNSNLKSYFTGYFKFNVLNNKVLQCRAENMNFDYETGIGYLRGFCGYLNRRYSLEVRLAVNLTNWRHISDDDSLPF